MGVLCLAALCPSQFGRGSWSLAGPGSVPPLGLAVLLSCCSSAAVLPSITCCCWARVLQRGCGSGGWDLGSRARAPRAPAGAGTLALLSYRPCTQPTARAKELHVGPGPSASSHSHQLLVARMAAATPSSEQCHPLPAAHPHCIKQCMEKTAQQLKEAGLTTSQTISQILQPQQEVASSSPRRM